MTNKQYCAVLLAFTLLGLMACKKKVQADYENALSEGTVLIENDTIQLPLHQTILFDFSFADGVNPIHYAWDIYQQDSSKFKYLTTEEFHFADPGIVGGPAAAIHSYEALEVGLHKLVFYNPYYNEEQLQKEQKGEDPFLIWSAFKEDFSVNDTLAEGAWKRPDFERHWIALQEATEPQKDSLWQLIHQHTYTIDSMPDSTTIATLSTKWAQEYTPFTTGSSTLELLDTLLGGQKEPNRKVWHDLRQQQDKQVPLHPSSNPQIYYVRVTSE